MAKAKSGVVVVEYNGAVREYSEAVHGEDYEKLAKEFAAKREKMGEKVVYQAK